MQVVFRVRGWPRCTVPNFACCLGVALPCCDQLDDYSIRCWQMCHRRERYKLLNSSAQYFLCTLPLSCSFDSSTHIAVVVLRAYSRLRRPIVKNIRKYQGYSFGKSLSGCSLYSSRNMLAMARTKLPAIIGIVAECFPGIYRAKRTLSILITDNWRSDLGLG